MASKISIELGGHSIRAAIFENGKTSIIPLGYSDSPHSCPSVAVRVAPDKFYFGEYAKYWVFNEPCNFYHLPDIESSSPILDSLYTSLFKFVIEKIKREGWTLPYSCTIIVPTNYASSDPRKNRIANAAKEAGISIVDFQFDAIALCAKRASIAEKESLLVFDLGYTGLSVSVLHRINNALQLLSSVRDNEIGGRLFDALIIKDIETNIPTRTSESFMSELFLSNGIAECAAHIKEELSFKEEVTQSIISSDYSISRLKFSNMIAPIFSSAMQACKEAILQSGKEYSDIHQVVLCGGCSNIPLVANLITKHFVGNGSQSLKILHYSNTVDYKYDTCFGSFFSNYSYPLSF